MSSAGVPAEIATILIAVIGLYLPGAWIALLVGERSPFDLPELLGLAFCGTVAITGIVSTIGFYAGSGLWSVIVPLALSVVASLLVGYRALRRRVVRLAPGGWVGVALGVAAGVLSLTQGQNLGGASDRFYHLAAIRSLLASDRVLVTDPFFGTVTRALDPSSGAWSPLAAALSRVSHIDPLELVPALTFAAAPLIVFALWSLARRASGKKWIAAVAAIVFAVAMLALDFRATDYPNHFSFATAILTLVLLTRVATARSRALVAAAAVAGYATIVSHLGSAELVMIAGVAVLTWTAVVALADRRRPNAHESGAVGRIVAAGLAGALPALPVLLPRLAVLKSASMFSGAAPLASGRGMQMFGHQVPFVSAGVLPNGWLLTILSLLLVAVAATDVFSRREQSAFLVLVIGSLPAVLLIDPLSWGLLTRLSPYMATRFAELLGFAPFAALAWGLAQYDRRHGKVIMSVAAAGLVVALVVGYPQLVSGWGSGTEVPSSIAFSEAADVRTAWGPSEITRLRSIFGDARPVVGGYPHTAYQIAGIAPVRIVAVPVPNTPAYFEERGGDARRVDMEVLFAETTPIAERVRIVRSYHMRYVVFDIAHIPAVAASFRDMNADPSDFALIQWTPEGLCVLKVLDAG
jgi:hypothetical protein